MERSKTRTRKEELNTPQTEIKMKRILLPLVASTMLVACTKKQATYSDNEMQIVSVEIDSTLYGMSELVKADSLLWVQTYSTNLTEGYSDTTWVSLFGAQRLGSMAPGHRLAILFEQEDRTKAKVAIDLTELIGRWVEPDAVDEGMVTGFELQEGGAATSINSRANHYVSWRIYNGKLMLVNTLNGIVDSDIPIDTFQISYLTADSLRIFSSLGKHFFRRSNSEAEDMENDYDIYTSPDAITFNPEGTSPDTMKREIPKNVLMEY